MSQPVPKSPNRRWLIEAKIHGNTFADAHRMLRELIAELDEKTNVASGGFDSGGHVTVTEYPDITHESYQRELQQYLEKERACPTP